MKMTRETQGNGLKKKFSRSRARGFWSTSNWSTFTVWDTSCHSLSPVSVAVSFASSPPWLWPMIDHVLQGRILVIRIEHLDFVQQIVSQNTCGQGDRSAAGIIKHPKLATFAQHRVGVQGVPHFGPPDRTAGRAMHEHHGNLAGRIRQHHRIRLPVTIIRGLKRKPPEENHCEAGGGNYHFPRTPRKYPRGQYSDRAKQSQRQLQPRNPHVKAKCSSCSARIFAIGHTVFKTVVNA